MTLKKSLKINKQTIFLSFTKGILLLFLQFCFHLMNLYISLAFLPPGSGSGRHFLYADPDPKHWTKFLNFKPFIVWYITAVMQSPKRRRINIMFYLFKTC